MATPNTPLMVRRSKARATAPDARKQAQVRELERMFSLLYGMEGRLAVMMDGSTPVSKEAEKVLAAIMRGGATIRRTAAVIKANGHYVEPPSPEERRKMRASLL